MDRARDAGMKISVDPASAAPLANDPIFLDRITPIDLLLPNEDEAAVLGRQLNVPEIVITRGARGATWTNGFESVDERALPVDVVDTTGAGDAFAAGFLSACGRRRRGGGARRGRRGWPPKRWQRRGGASL